MATNNPDLQGDIYAVYDRDGTYTIPTVGPTPEIAAENWYLVQLMCPADPDLVYPITLVRNGEAFVFGTPAAHDPHPERRKKRRAIRY